MLKSIVNPQQLISAIRAESEADIGNSLANVATLENDILSGVSMIKDGFEFYDRLIGVQLLSSYCRSHGDFISAMALAQAAFESLENDELVLSGKRKDLTHMATNLLDVLASGLTEIGNAAQIVKQADRWAEWVTRAGMADYYLGQIRLCQIEALLLCGDFDRARELLVSVGKLKLDSSQILAYKRFVAKLPVLVRPVDEPEPPPIDMKDVLVSSVDVFKTLGGSPNVQSALSQATGQIDMAAMLEGVMKAATQFGYTAPPVDVAGIVHHAALLEQSRNPNGALMSLLDSFAVFFQNDQASHQDDILQQLVVPLEQMVSYATQLGYWEHMMDALWLKAIVFKRLGDLQKSAITLRQLRDEIDRKRLVIADPRNRAGIAEYLKHLYPVSAEVLYCLDDKNIEELFHVVEAPKAKILTELTVADVSRQQEVDGASFRSKEDRILRDLCSVLVKSPSRAIYITYLIDEDVTYAVAVTPRGSVHKHKISIGRNLIDESARRLSELCNGNPRNPAQSSSINPLDPWQRPFEPIIESLSPLVEWIAPYLKDADVLCFSPDRSLHNIPLHMLAIDGKPLMSIVGVCIVPSAEVLIKCAHRRSAIDRDFSAYAFLVPQSSEGSTAKKEQAAFEKVASSLENCIPTTVVQGGCADWETLQATALSNKIVLLASHGQFNQKDPLGASGIYCAYKGKLPGESHDKTNHLITPELFRRLELSASRVTLLACVSGETIEISSREALGLIWAAFQAGSSSILATAWKVNVDTSTDLLQALYKYWIVDNRPLWKAHALSMQKLQTGNKTLSHPYHWAPFVLYGYWE